MEFNTVKAKLNLLYTGSLLIILVIFIIILYIFISGTIKNQQIDKLNLFYENEKQHMIETLAEAEANSWEKDDDIVDEDTDIEDSDESININENDSDKNLEDEVELEDEFYKDNRLDFKPVTNIFYYLFDTNNRLVEGEETIRGFVQSNDIKKMHLLTTPYIKEIKWEDSHILLSSMTIQFGQNKIGTVIIGTDITNEKHLIQNIIWILLALTVVFSLLFAWAGNFFAGQAMKPIQKSFQTQRKFVSDASHELRTPLSIFYSSVDVLSREEKENLSPFGKEILEDIKNESEMMNNLLNDLLFLARNDQETFELDLEEIDLSYLLNSLIQRFKRIVPSSITLNENIKENVLINGDKVRLQQLFYILLDNAVRYTKEGKITFTLTNNEYEIKIIVQDTGSGIPADNLPHIFDRFYRGDSSRKRDGSGLGLSIAKTIVDVHGGKIQVKSEMQIGTSFIVTFPNI